LRSQPVAHMTFGARSARRVGRCTPRGDRAGTSWNRVGCVMICTVFAASAGCAGQSNFLTGGPTVGQMKASLSHLEFENEQLKKRTAKLEQESRSFEDRLVQEQIDNGDLTARLDDARNLLRDRGLEPDVRLGSRRRGEEDDLTGNDDGSRARTLPAGRTSRQRRKTPFAQISGPVTSLPPAKDDDGAAAEPTRDRDARTRRSTRGLDDDLDHHSFHTGELRWLPVAGAPGDPASQIR
jgi:hypothetical protein